MSILNLNERQSSGGTFEDRPIIPTDIYRMKIIEAKMEDDKFNPNKDGTFPQKLVLTWEMSVLTEEQQEAADDAEEDWSNVRVWSRFAPYYGTVKAGGPSKFKAFIDSLVDQGLLELNLDAFDVEDLIDIEQRVSVERYIKTMGQNAGQPGNKAIAYAPVRTKKNSNKATVNLKAKAEQIPDPAVVESTRPGRNVPQPIGADDEDEALPF